MVDVGDGSYTYMMNIRVRLEHACALEWKAKSSIANSVTRLGAARIWLQVAAWYLLAMLGCALMMPNALGAVPATDTQVGPVLQLDERVVGTLVGKHLRYLEDPAGALTLEQVQAMPTRFVQSTSAAPNFSFTASTYWFHLRLDNHHATQRDWLLEAAYPLIDHYTFHLLVNGQWVDTTEAGRAFPFHQRAIKNRNVIYPFTLKPGQVSEMYIRVQTSSSLQLPLRVWTPQAFLAKDHDEQVIQGIYYGILLSMLLYNFLIFLSIREISYLNYVHFIGSSILFLVSLSGYGFEYLWPESTRWAMTAQPVLISFTLVGMLNFSRSFLSLDRLMPRVARLVRMTAYLMLALTLAPFILPYAMALKLAVAGALVSALIVLTCGGISLASGARQARYFMLAWTVLLLGISLYALKTFGLLPSNLLTEYAMQIGSALEAVLLSFALAHRMAILKGENERIQQEANYQLELRVAQRTQELDDALHQLSAANAALLEKNRTDGLTGVKNRRFFDEQLTTEIKRSSRAQLALTLLLIDIDHFKQVNDRYGHLAGDACLRAVAKAVYRCLQRPSDELARYGGEEFAALLPHTNRVGGLQMAERIRAAVAALTFEYDGHSIPVTVSIGCATTVPTRDYVCDKLIAAADGALYEAKRSGRNRVVGADIVVTE